MKADDVARRSTEIIEFYGTNRAEALAWRFQCQNEAQLLTLNLRLSLLVAATPAATSPGHRDLGLRKIELRIGEQRFEVRA